MSDYKAALEYVVDKIAKVDTIEIENRNYSSKQLVPVKSPMMQKLSLSTLQGLVELYKSSDKMFESANIAKEDVIFHIDSHNTVSIKSLSVNEWGERECIAVATSRDWSDVIGRLVGLDTERFIIQLITCFEKTPSRDQLIAVVSSMSDTSDINVEDDGMTQSTTVGKAIKTKVRIENPIYLNPIVNFPEIDNPSIPFVFRIDRNTRSGDIGVSLHHGIISNEQYDTMINIKEFLLKSLSDNTEILM